MTKPREVALSGKELRTYGFLVSLLKRTQEMLSTKRGVSRITSDKSVFRLLLSVCLLRGHKRLDQILEFIRGRGLTLGTRVALTYLEELEAEGEIGKRSWRVVRLEPKIPEGFGAKRRKKRKDLTRFKYVYYLRKVRKGDYLSLTGPEWARVCAAIVQNEPDTVADVLAMLVSPDVWECAFKLIPGFKEGIEEGAGKSWQELKGTIPWEQMRRYFKRRLKQRLDIIYNMLTKLILT